MGLLQGNWKLQGFVTLLCCCSALFSCSTAVTNPNEVIALLAIQQAFNGNPPWSSGTDPCASAWIGVTCDGNTTVTSLVLSSMSITGTLSPAIGALSNLIDLEISFNPGISGSLPQELGNLTKLTTLSLQSCSYSGPIPHTLSNLINLTFLALNGNQLTGTIPSGLGALTQLYWFDLSINNLTGSLPVSTTSLDGHGLDQLQNALHFHLYNNSLSGSIPPELGGTTTGRPLRSLIHLLLDSNAFTGTIPDSLGNITTLEILNLMNNKLTGSIPQSLNNIVSPTGTLQQLQLGNNLLSGTIPNLSGLYNLTLIDLSNNQYDPQPYPSWLNVTTNVETITLHQSNLVGQLPADVLSYPLLEVL
jgi:Leucine-rich repeat (LRR) protein